MVFKNNTKIFLKLILLDQPPFQYHILRVLGQPSQGELWNQMYHLVFIYQIPFTCWPYSFALSRVMSGPQRGSWSCTALQQGWWWWCWWWWISSFFFVVFIISHFQSAFYITPYKIQSCVPLPNISNASHTSSNDIQCLAWYIRPFMVHQTLFFSPSLPFAISHQPPCIGTEWSLLGSLNIPSSFWSPCFYICSSFIQGCCLHPHLPPSATSIWLLF